MRQSAHSRDIAASLALTILIFAAAVYLPIIGFFCSLLLPLPILFLRSSYGRNIGAAFAALAVIGMALFLGGFRADLLFFSGFLLIGFMLGEMFEFRVSLEKTVIYTVTAALSAGIMGLIVYSGFIGKGAIELLTEYVGVNLRFTLDVYEELGVTQESIHQIASSLDQIQYVLVRIMPSLMVAAALVVTWATLLLCRPLFRLKNLPYPDFGELNNWKAPDYLVWGAIACGAMLLSPFGLLKLVGMNGAIVLMVIYFFQGIAILAFFFEKKKLPVILRFLFYSLIFIQQFLLLLVIGCGFFDMWLNFRKLETKNSG